MYNGTPYEREILILRSTIIKLAALNLNEDIASAQTLSSKLTQNDFRTHFTPQEKLKIKDAINYLKEQERLELPHIQNNLTRMLNNEAPIRDYFERTFFSSVPPQNREAYIESQFTASNKITNDDINNIVQDANCFFIEIKDKNFSDLFLKSIKLLFGKLRYAKNGTEYIYKDITFTNCKFHNLNLSNMRFEMNVYFKKCSFTGNTDFRNSVFKEDVSFANSCFHGTTHFEDTNFLKNANFEQIETNGYAFLFNQYDLDNSENDDWFRYLWSFQGAKFNSKVAFFKRVFPARVNLSFVSFNNTFYFTDCKLPLKVEAKNFNFSPAKIPDFEISIRTLIAALDECYCNAVKNELLLWEKKAHELSTKTIIDDEKGELLSPRAAAAILGYSEASLRTMRSQYPDKIKFVKRGNRVFYYKSSIDEFKKLTPHKKK